MKKLLILVIPLLVLIACATGQVKRGDLWLGDMVYMVSGEEYECEISKITSDSVYIVTEEGRTVLDRKDVRSVDIAKKRKGYEWDTVRDIDDPVLKNALKKDVSEYREMGYVNIHVKKTLKIYEDSSYSYSIRCIRGITSESGRKAGTIGHYYRNSDEDIEINFARTVTGEDDVLHLKGIAIEDASVYSGVPSYENLHERKFAMREVKPGNILDFKVTVTGKVTDSSPRILDITLGDEGPTMEGTFEVIAPRDFELIWQQWRIERPEILRGDGTKILTWKVENVPSLVREDNRPPENYILPRVVVGLSDEWGRCAEVFREYLGNQYEPEAKTEKGIYEEILRMVRFVDIPSHSYSSYPKETGVIVSSRLANSLDKAVLLFQAYRGAGFPSELVLVRSKSRGVMAEEVPSLFQFDGALVKLGDMYLDPSSELNSFGYIRPKYQGTKGLSIHKDNLVEIPLLPPEMENVIIKRKVSVKENGDANIDEKIVFTGKQLLNLRTLKYYREEQRRNILESFAGRNLENAELKSYDIEHLNDNEPELTVTLSYSVPSLGLVEGNFMLLHVPGVTYSAYSVGAEERRYPIFWDCLSREEKEIEIDVPVGYSVRYLPEGIETGSPSLDFSCSFEESGGNIIYRDIYTDTRQMVPTEEYPEYKDAIMKIASISEEWIILEK